MLGRLRDVALSTALGSVYACATGSADREPSHTTVDSAGITIVESRKPAWGERAPTVDTTPVLRIGSDTAGPYQFSHIFHGTLLDDGNLAVTEFGSGEVRVFDSAGTIVRTLGRRGTGPGEFEALSGVFPYRGDSIAAYDQALRRATIFSRSSGGARVVLNPILGNFTTFGILGDSALLLYSPGGSFHPDKPPGLQWDSTDVVLIRPDGSAGVVGNLPSRQQVVLTGGETRSTLPEHRSIHAAARNGFYWATSERYEIGFYDPSGALKRIVRRRVTPRPVEASAIEADLSAREAWARRADGERAAVEIRKYYGKAPRLEHVPFFETAFVDKDQRLWISHPAWPAYFRMPKAWSVFSSAGLWLGDIEAPERLWILDSRGDMILGVWQDDNDVPYVQLHRLVHR